MGDGARVASLSPEDRERLVKVLRLISSPHNGEKTAAAERAQAMLESRGLDWGDVIGTERIVEKPVWILVRDDDEADLVEKCIMQGQHVKPWEWEFLNSINAWLAERGKLTPKQRDKLNEIIVKLKAMGRWS
jgi:hypothetical protein